MVSNAKVLDLEKDGSGKGVSNKLSLIGRTERDVVWSARTIAPITESIKSRLARQLRVVSRNQQIDLYTPFSKSSQTKKMRGTLFEAIGLDIAHVTDGPAPSKCQILSTLVHKPRISDQ